MENKTKNRSYRLERFSIKATRWIGSLESLLVHTIFFSGIFSLAFFGVEIDKILLIVTTIVSYEAIYLSIFIQMSVNRQAKKLKAVARDVEEIQEDVEGIEKDIDEIQEDVEEIQEDVEGIEKDVDEIQEDVEEINEEETAEDQTDSHDEETLVKIQDTLSKLMQEISELKKTNKKD